VSLLGYIERAGTDTFYYYNGGRIVGDPFSLGWAVKWYGERVKDMRINEKRDVSRAPIRR